MVVSCSKRPFLLVKLYMAEAAVGIREALGLHYATYHVGGIVPAVGTELAAICRQVGG